MTLKRSHLELLVGLFVAAGLAAIAYLAIEIGGGSMINSSTYTVTARFSNVGGLNRGANVTISGVTVGQVEKIMLDESFRAEALLRIRRDVALPIDTSASIRSTGLIGDKFIALTPGVEEEPLADGSMITDTQPAVDIEALISRFAFGNVDQPEKP